MCRPQSFVGKMQWGDVWGNLLESAMHMWSVIIVGEKERHEMRGEIRASNPSRPSRLGLGKQIMKRKPGKRHSSPLWKGVGKEQKRAEKCSWENSGNTRWFSISEFLWWHFSLRVWQNLIENECVGKTPMWEPGFQGLGIHWLIADWEDGVYFAIW